MADIVADKLAELAERKVSQNDWPLLRVEMKLHTFNVLYC